MKTPCYLTFVMAAALACTQPVWAEDDFEFDDSEYDDVVFEDDLQESGNWFIENLSMEITHGLTSSRMQNWDVIGNKTTGSVGWSSALSPALYAKIEGQLDLYWADDSNASEHYDARFTDTFIQASVANISGKLGYFTLGWGEVEGSQVLDVINPTASITSGSLDVAGESQLLLTTDMYLGRTTGSLFVNLDPKVADIPFPGVTTKNTDELEYGGKLKLTLSGSDVGLYAAHLLPNNPVFTSPVNPDKAVANPYTLIGTSMNRTLGNMLLKADIAYKQGLETLDAEVMSEPVSINRLDYAAGVEYSFSDGKQLVVALNNKQILDFKASYLAIPGFSGRPAIESKEHASQLMLSFSDTYVNETLSLDVGSMASLDGEMVMLFYQLDYSLSDRWSVNSGQVFAFADAESLFAAYDQEIMLSAGVTWSN